MDKKDWTIIGAGPAGIAALGNLLDQGIEPSKIAWIDPEFKAGDFGTLWRNVPSNTKAKLFLAFLHACRSFHFKDHQTQFALAKADPEKSCALHLMAEPLQFLTDEFKKTVHTIQDKAEHLVLKNRLWNIQLKNKTIESKNVILAIGAEAKKFSYPLPQDIPLHDAMDSEGIKKHLNSNDKIAVFGSSHSAILVLKNLLEHSVKEVINFYRSPLLYAIYLKDSILFDDTGLKGPTAEWARDHLHGNLPNNLKRIYSNKENIEQHLPECTKAIYAVGFERRQTPIVEGIGHLSYQENTGIIAPGLFGLGIAFPEAKQNQLGMTEYRVGLWKFMEYLQRILPIWLNYAP